MYIYFTTGLSFTNDLRNEMVYFSVEGLPCQKGSMLVWKLAQDYIPKADQLGAVQAPVQRIHPLPSLGIFSVCASHFYFFNTLQDEKNIVTRGWRGGGVGGIFFINMWKMWVLLKWFFFTPLWYLKIIFGIHPKSFHDNSCRSQHDCDIKFIKIQNKTNLPNGLGKYILLWLSFLSIKDFISLKLSFIFHFRKRRGSWKLLTISLVRY